MQERIGGLSGETEELRLSNKIGGRDLGLRGSLMQMLLAAQQLSRVGRVQWRPDLHTNQWLLPLAQPFGFLVLRAEQPRGDVIHPMAFILYLSCFSCCCCSRPIFFLHGVSFQFKSLSCCFSPLAVLEIYELQPIKWEPSFSSQLWKLYISVSSLLFYGQDQMQKC